MANNLADKTISNGFFRAHPEITVGVFLDLFQRLAGRSRKDLVQTLTHLDDLAGLDLDIGRLAADAAARFVQQEARIGQGVAIFLLRRRIDQSPGAGTPAGAENFHRRADKLEELANALRTTFDVDVLVRPIDLMQPDAFEQLIAVAEEVEIGLYLIIAGGDTVAARFIDADIDRWNELIARNIGLLTKSVHAFARIFAARGRGGVGVVGSDSGFNGAGRISVYSASKAYALNLVESIWAELKDKNVDATYFAIGATDTPKLRGLMEMRGVAPGDVNLTPPDTLARWIFQNLGNGPTQVFDVDPQSMDPLTSPKARRARVEPCPRSSRVRLRRDCRSVSIRVDDRSGRADVRSDRQRWIRPIA